MPNENHEVPRILINKTHHFAPSVPDKDTVHVSGPRTERDPDIEDMYEDSNTQDK